jgi:Lar family restriction alleviation protein
MKFSKDTSRLVEGCAYWCVDPNDLTGEPYRSHYDRDDNGNGYLWGDECPAPTVEVEPERPPEPVVLPCPFCGSADVAPNGTDDQPLWNQWVRCASCEAEGPTRTGGHAIAATAWNTRAPAPAPAEPSPPAWVPPVCPAGQAILDNGVDLRILLVAVRDITEVTP